MSTDAATVADTIREQVGIFGFGVVGASGIHATESDHMPGLAFHARLHKEGQTQVRVMLVQILLDPTDTYTVRVLTRMGEQVREWERLYFDDLTPFLYRLDADGF